jgi:hypothetical protein
LYSKALKSALDPPPPFYSTGNGGSFPGGGVKWTICLHLVPRLRVGLLRHHQSPPPPPICLNGEHRATVTSRSITRTVSRLKLLPPPQKKKYNFLYSPFTSSFLDSSTCFIYSFSDVLCLSSEHVNILARVGTVKCLFTCNRTLHSRGCFCQRQKAP